jgi:hypothetical protein
VIPHHGSLVETSEVPARAAADWRPSDWRVVSAMAWGAAGSWLIRLGYVQLPMDRPPPEAFGCMVSVVQESWPMILGVTPPATALYLSWPTPWGILIWFAGGVAAWKGQGNVRRAWLVALVTAVLVTAARVLVES